MPFAFDTRPVPPHIASARASELRAELTPEQQGTLRAQLGQHTAAEWAAWMQAHLPEIQRYDALPTRLRRQALAKSHAAPPPPPPSAPAPCALLLQYWCARLALVQWRVAHHLPPQGPPLHDAADQRQALLAVWAALHSPSPSELWPFEGFAEVAASPFRRDDS